MRQGLPEDWAGEPEGKGGLTWTAPAWEEIRSAAARRAPSSTLSDVTSCTFFRYPATSSCCSASYVCGDEGGNDGLGGRVDQRGTA